MSAIALFFELPVTALNGLEVASKSGTYQRFLKENGVEVVNYRWSGYVFATLLPFLQDRDIDLMKSEFDELSSHLTQASGATHLIFTEKHRSIFQELLDPRRFNEAELRAYYNDFNGTNEQQVGKAMLDGITALRDALASISTGQIILFMIA